MALLPHTSHRVKKERLSVSLTPETASMARKFAADEGKKLSWIVAEAIHALWDKRAMYALMEEEREREANG